MFLPRPGVPHVGDKLVEVGQIAAQISRKLDKCGPEFVQTGPIWSISAQIWSKPPNFDRIRPRFGRSCRMLIDFGPDLVEAVPCFVEFGPELAKNGQQWPKFGPNCRKRPEFRRNRPNVDPNLVKCLECIHVLARCKRGRSAPMPVGQAPMLDSFQMRLPAGRSDITKDPTLRGGPERRSVRDAKGRSAPVPTRQAPMLNNQRGGPTAPRNWRGFQSPGLHNCLRTCYKSSGVGCVWGGPPYRAHHRSAGSLERPGPECVR